MKIPHRIKWILAGLLVFVVGACGSAAPTPTIAPTADQATPLPATATPSAATQLPAPTEVPPQGIIPIFENETGFVLGGIWDGAWVDAETVGNTVTEDIRFRLFKSGEPAGEADGLISTEPESSGPCAFPAVHLAAMDRMEDSVGVAGDWDVTPRPATTLSVDIPEYTEVIATLLAENSLPNADVRITGVMKADIEGDGKDEVVISASRLTSGEAEGAEPGSIWPAVKAGDYTLVALRRIEADGVKTIPLFITTYPESSDMSYPWRPSLIAMLDLNGDGTLEIVVKEDAFEGMVYEVFQVTASGVELVLSGGCSI